MAPKTFLALALLGLGCATPSWSQRPINELNAHVRHLAAQDLQCPERDVVVQEEAVHGMGSEGCSMDIYGVSAWGCGRKASYGFDERGGLRLDFIRPGEGEVRQWVSEWLRAQHPSTAVALGEKVDEASGALYLSPVPPPETGAPWKVFPMLWEGRGAGCYEASAGGAPGVLSAIVCGKNFTVYVSYQGPPAAMPAPQGIHLQQLADALAAKLNELNSPRPTTPAVAAQP